MNGVRTEHRHHSDEQIREALAFARDLVDELELPDALRGVAFVKAVELRTAKQITVEAIAPGMPTMAIPRGV